MAMLTLFQSTPAIAGGRIAAATGPGLVPLGFNPRPPLLAGESRQAASPGGSA